ncbi:disease resistance protein RPP8 [Ziziphus jujuba]|uniref:Disease resistance protein RPP8 n=1 Tax=Ziziphus jujuba TaxID=326968 RepID=A0ABM3I7M0_ZIZJJ|nr:disease resistance protein RPP8 [Ziziphus jujuba]
MADIVGGALMENITRLLQQDEEYLLHSVELEVKALQQELVAINSFLKKSESKRIENDEVQEVADRIRDVAGEAEDVVDTYMAEIIELRGRRLLLRKLYHSLFSRGKKLRAAAKKIKSVRNTIHLIYSKKDRYGILQDGDIESSSTAVRAPTVKEAAKEKKKQKKPEHAGSAPTMKEAAKEKKKQKKPEHDGSAPTMKEAAKEEYTGEIVEIDIAKSSDHGKASSSEHKGSSSQQEDSHSHSQRWPRSEFDYVVGFEIETTTLISHLVKGDPTLDVISITGMGGLGKTTLASKIYEDRRVRDHFDCQAWVFVSQEYKTKDYLFVILRCLISSSIPEEMFTVSEKELKLTLRAFLREKRYLIVFDDLRTTRVWDEIRDAFPNSFNGSRLLITSDKQVALLARQTSPYSLKSLDDETSWQLFCKKVSPIIKSNPDLEPPGKQLVQSCMGAPLAILVLGGLLVHKEVKYETWSKLIDHVSFNYSQNTRSLDILRLSYTHLPRNLKPCFLYLGVFPMDSEISVRYLIKLWLAEGAIQQTETKTVEDVADDYLEELRTRSLIQVTKRRTDGGAKACRIHHLLREISISEGLKEKFFEVHSGYNPASIRKARRVSRVTNRRTGGAVQVMASRIDDLLIRELSIVDTVKARFLEARSETNYASTSKTRRLSIQGNISEYISSYPDVPSRAHSLFIFGEGDDFDIKHWRWIFKNFKFLRVLCLEKLFLNSIPKHIEKLTFLRYLRIRSEKLIEIAAIPASICNLQYLEEINVDGHVEECLPKEIWKMMQLRNLRFSGGMSILATPTSMDNISTKLQVLSYVLVDENTKFLMSYLRFPYLRKLHLKYDHGLTKMNEFEVADVLESLFPKENEEELGSLKKLESLKILDFPTSEPRPNLFPSTLVKISFIRSYFNSIHIGILAKLPNLQILKLKGRFPYYGILGPLRCVADDFPQLRILQMIDLEIEIWILESGAMKKLEHLVISECYHVRNVPEELAKLSALTLVEVSQMSRSFKKKLKKLDFLAKWMVVGIRHE